MKIPKPKEGNPSNVVSARKPLKPSLDCKDNAGDVQEILVRKEGRPRTSIKEIVEDIKLKSLKATFVRLPLVGSEKYFCGILLACSHINPRTSKSVDRVSDYARCEEQELKQLDVDHTSDVRNEEEFSKLKLELFKVKTFNLREVGKGGEGGKQSENESSNIGGSGK